MLWYLHEICNSRVFYFIVDIYKISLKRLYGQRFIFWRILWFFIYHILQANVCLQGVVFDYYFWKNQKKGKTFQIDLSGSKGNGIILFTIQDVTKFPHVLRSRWRTILAIGKLQRLVRRFTPGKIIGMLCVAEVAPSQRMSCWIGNFFYNLMEAQVLIENWRKWTPYYWIYSKIALWSFLIYIHKRKHILNSNLKSGPKNGSWLLIVW